MECINCHKEESIKGQKRCYRCTELIRLKHKRYTDNNKLKAVQYLGGKCKDCGLETTILDIYEFHHTNPNEKEFELNKLFGRKGWDIIQYELDKCVVVCANCHRIRHYNLRKEEDGNRLQINVRKFNKWTNKELEILRQIYPNERISIVMKALPNRTWTQIQHKANDLGIKKFEYISRSKWSEEEINILLRNYKKRNIETLIKLFPYRTIRGLKDQMKRMNIKI